ncbi:MAG: TIGR02147 family protein [Pseudobdellovibrionaceae bacterium]|nr:MAG: TIGR02147 family protein [Pseudobdellovibrionaceae bacterium]
MEINERYRSILRQELEKRCTKNKSYSLRSFAKLLEVSPSQLSRVLAGTKNLSVMNAKRIAEILFKNEPQKSLFVSLVEINQANNDDLKQRLSEQLKENNAIDEKFELELEVIKYISDWYHIAILELTYIVDEPLSSSIVVKALGISAIQAKLAMERLERLGLLKRRDGRLVKSRAHLQTPSGIPNKSLRQFHQQMLEKAQQALVEQSVDRKYFKGKTMSISSDDLGEVRSLIDEVLNKISKLANNRKKKDSLYQLNIQFFDLLSGGKNEEDVPAYYVSSG